ncbi:MAG TPA: CHAT domain-containing protein [Bradyrhizobium sp.]|nr:CHAT domain-containing protein [Bradyrhizobium sp.]
MSDDARIFQLKDTAAVLGDMLGTVPGLTAETNKQNSSDEPLTHLRLILSASELALLPFELALSPAGLPGAGQYLLLQPQMPVCLTREVRRTPDNDLKWPDLAPRVLFVAADPPEVGEIPLEAHLLALRRSIAPWVKYYNPNDEAARAKVLSKNFVFLPNASLEAIERECASSSFTHVHILAHGIPYGEGHDNRYALALHDPRDFSRTDRVSGSRLATALRAAGRFGNNALSRPAVVTMASCDAANVGSVAGAGSSIAHALHEAGIAMVVAGQFPLSFEGSVRLVEVLYDGLLSGTDPRHLIFDVRRRLYGQLPQRHDWASLTAYLSLPRDFDKQLSATQIKQAMESINAAMTYADEATRHTSVKLQSKLRTEQKQDNLGQLLEDAKQRMRDAKKRLNDLVATIPEEEAKIYGLLASTEKRQAQVFYSAGLASESNKLLVNARDHYWEAFQTDRALHWAVVQYLSLSLIVAHIPGLMEGENVPGSQPRPEKSPKQLWSMARLLSLYDTNHESPVTRGWAHANLIELYLLSLLPDLVGSIDQAEAMRLAVEHADQLLNIAGWDSFEAYSTRRQVLRYLEWYNDLTGVYLAPLVDLAEQIFNRFPPEVEDEF